MAIRSPLAAGSDLPMLLRQRIATPVCALVRNDIPAVRRMNLQWHFLSVAFFTPGSSKLKAPKNSSFDKHVSN